MKRLKQLAMLLLMVFVSGCGQAQAVSASVLPSSSEPASVSEISQVQSVSQIVPESYGEGYFSLEDDDQQAPDAQQIQLMLNYMDLYYESMASMEPLDPAPLFAEENADQAMGNRMVWEYLIETRKMLPGDLSVEHYEYTLTLRRMQQQEDGSVSIMVREDSVQNFALSPQVDSESFGVYHSFVLVQQQGEWKLQSHMQLDSLYYIVVLGNPNSDRSMYQQRSFDTQEEDAQQYFERLLDELLEQARENIASRAQGEAQTLQVAHQYDRQAAVDYAMEWVEQRNDYWPDYGIYGGNCQNYISQCLDAGGIPMDPYGAYVWKWYGDTPNNSAGTFGRSASWSGVEEFRDYAENNDGFGLVAQVEAPLDSGEIGDILELGTQNDWKHTVLIVDVITDEKGNTVDYLINSNTANLRNFPAGAYGYTLQSLVKVAGWND